MKERPILFSGPMVRAILDGRKTQTRRIARLPDSARGVVPEKIERGHIVRGGPPSPNDWVATYVGGGSGPGGTWQRHAIACPYGAPGDRLWVRETWAAHWMYNNVPPTQARSTLPDDNTWYLADGDEAPGTHGCPANLRGKWRPSIHMPRWASRLTLEVTGVRVERLQDITEADAAAEGVGTRETLKCIDRTKDLRVIPCIHCGARRSEHIGMAMACRGGYGTVWNGNTARGGFIAIWDQINGDRVPWKSNPWVWVVSFKRAS